MRGVGSEQALNRIEQALRQDEPERGMDWRFFIGGQEYTALLQDEGELAVEGADGPAIELTGEVAQKLPQELENAEVMVTLLVGGVEVEKFSGNLLLPEHTEYGTELGAATGGFFAESTELGSFMQFSGQTPSSVMYSVLTLLPYNLAAIDVAPVSGPLFTRSGEAGFSFIQKVKDVTSAVLPEAGISWFDNASNGTRVFRESTLAEGVNPVWTFEVSRDIKPSEFRVERAADRVRQVVASRPKTSHLATEDPNEVLARVDVPGSLAPVGTVSVIELSEMASASDAQDRVYLEADKIARRYVLDFITQYPHPLLERGDIVSIVEPGQDSFGRYIKYWLCVLGTEGVKLPGKKGHYGGAAVLIATERLIRPEVFRAAGGVTEMDFLAAYGWGVSWEGTGRFWVNPNKATFAGVDELGFWIDEDLAAPQGAGIDGGGLYFDG